jgi:hypothetical protein
MSYEEEDRAHGLLLREILDVYTFNVNIYSQTHEHAHTHIHAHTCTHTDIKPYLNPSLTPR